MKYSPDELLIASSRRPARGRGPCGGGRALAHSRRRRAARPRALERADARVPARQRGAQLLHRRRTGVVRLCRAGTDRRLLPRRRADRRRGQHQPRRHRRLPAERRPPGRLVRLVLPLLPRTARDPVQARAHEADARRAGRLRQRSRYEPSRHLPSGRAGRAPDRAVRVRLRPRRGALPAGHTPSGSDAGGDLGQHRIRLRTCPSRCRSRASPTRRPSR